MYSEVVKIQEPVGGVFTSTGTRVRFGSKRRCSVLGFGVQTVSAFTIGTGATRFVIKLQSSVNGAAWGDIATITSVAGIDGLGKITETSELMKGRDPTSPDASMNAVRLNEGDMVRVEVTTAEVAGTGGTAGNYQAYILVSPRGSL